MFCKAMVLNVSTSVEMKDLTIYTVFKTITFSIQKYKTVWTKAILFIIKLVSAKVS